MIKHISFTAFFLIYAYFAFLVPLIAQEGAPSATPSEISPTWTETPPLSPSETATALAASPSPEITESVSPIPENSSPSPEATAETTEASPEATLSVLPELTEASAEATDLVPEITQPGPTASPSPTASSMPDRVLRGRVTYQVGENHSGILVRATDANGWQSSTISDELGIFNLEIYSDSAYLLEFSALLYLKQSIWIVPGDSPTPIHLLGGDVNSDGCINQVDLDLLILHYDTDTLVDIDKDGQTAASDLAILTGNYQASCGLVVELTEVVAESEATAELTETVHEVP